MRQFGVVNLYLSPMISRIVRIDVLFTKYCCIGQCYVLTTELLNLNSMSWSNTIWIVRYGLLGLWPIFKFGLTTIYNLYGSFVM